MDKKLLNALNNLSFALEEISEILKESKDSKEKKSATTEAMASGDLSVQLKELSEGIRLVKEDTQEILKNQKTILQISKERQNESKTSLFEDAGGNKKQESQIKKGVGTILLIAVGVLAIGMAFKIIGKIDFLSVVGLGLAIVFISHAFETVAGLKMSIKDVSLISSSMVIMSIGVTISSWILSGIKPISITQSLTMILIGVGFSMLSPAINKIIHSFGGMTWGNIIKSVMGLVVVLPAIALGITLSSWILRNVTPISFGQAITSILIAGMFTVVSFGIRRIVGAFNGIDLGSLVKTVIFLPLILPAIAVGIAVSSWVLRRITPITFDQALTGILIAGMFTVISYGMKKIISAVDGIKNPAKLLLLPLVLPLISTSIWLSSLVLSKVVVISGSQFLVSLGISVLFIAFAFMLRVMSPVLSKLNWSDVVKIPLIMIALSFAIMASSHILKDTAEISYSTMLRILLFSVVFALSAIVIGTVAWVISKYFGVGNVLKGAVAIVALAGTVMLSSWLISKGVYKNYPDWKWSLMVGLSLGIFGVVAWGLMKLPGSSLVNYVKGSLVISLLAGVVMLSSKILDKGTYKNYPKLGWALGVGASLAAFGVGALLLGTEVFGPQALVFAAGLGAILVVVGTIVAASHILSMGNFKEGKYPSLGWSTSVGLSLAAFGAGITLLGGLIVGTLGLGAIILGKGKEAVLGIAYTMVKTSYILAGGKWQKGPTEEWAKGVAIALGAFAPVYEMMIDSQSLFSSLTGTKGITPKKFSDAVVTISRGIVSAANEFAKSPGNWKNGPSYEWSNGVGKAIGAFAPVYSMLMKGGISEILNGKGPNIWTYVMAIKAISKGIVASAGIFASAKGVFRNDYPDPKWGMGVGGAIKAFAPLFKSLSEDTGWFTSGDEVISNITKGIRGIAQAIVDVAWIFSGAKSGFNFYPDSKWSYGVAMSTKKYVWLSGVLMDSGYNSYMDPSIDIAKNMVKFAKIIERGRDAFSTKVDPNFMKNMSTNAGYYMQMVKKLSSESLSGMTKKLVFGDPVTNMANGMVKLAMAYDRMASALTKFNRAVQGLDEKKINTFKGLNKGMIDRADKVGLNEKVVAQAPGNIVAGQNVMAQFAPPTGRKKETTRDIQERTKGRHGTNIQQSDKIIDLLSKLVSNTGQLERFINEKLSEG